jgi:hypothetical protein
VQITQIPRVLNSTERKNGRKPEACSVIEKGYMEGISRGCSRNVQRWRCMS